jgi:hypothetical protein
MNRLIAACVFVLFVVTTPACIVTSVVEAESYDSHATNNYTYFKPQAREADVLDADCRWPCYRLGAAAVGFFPPKQSKNVKATGPLLPIFPAPGEGTSYAQEQFFIGLQVRPGQNSFLILEPSEYLVTVPGRAEALAPVVVEDCHGNPVPHTRLTAFGSARCFILYYGINRAEAQQFTLAPANIEADEIVYMFPDIEWTPGTYSWAE